MDSQIDKLSKELDFDLAKHIEEFACAYYQKTKCDPRKIVMLHHYDMVSGVNVYWFEKKRGRSRKKILSNLKK